MRRECNEPAPYQSATMDHQDDCENKPSSIRFGLKHALWIAGFIILYNVAVASIETTTYSLSASKSLRKTQAQVPISKRIAASYSYALGSEPTTKEQDDVLLANNDTGSNSFQIPTQVPEVPTKAETVMPPLVAEKVQVINRMSDEVDFEQLHIFTTESGCRMARWVFYLYTGRPLMKDCQGGGERSQRLTVELMEPLDTIYVPFTSLSYFVDKVLPNITQPFVLITGQFQHIRPALDEERKSKIIQSESVLHWFCQNLSIYGGSFQRHPKMSPFPYGILDSHAPEYKKAFIESMQRENDLSTKNDRKTKLVFHGAVAATGGDREHVPIGERLSYPDFLKALEDHMYVFSPNGDRPECYRHYESVGLGAVPITQLDPYLFRHLAGHVVFNNTDWNLAHWEERARQEKETMAVLQTKKLFGNPRNLVLEEYWIKYMEEAVRKELTWWNHEEKRVSKSHELMKYLLLDPPTDLSSSPTTQSR